MGVTEIATGHQVKQVKLARRTSSTILRLWDTVDPGQIALSWATRSTTALAVLAGAQAEAAGDADPYVTDVLRAQSIDPVAAGTVVPSAFAGVASDGRGLLDLLNEAPIVAKSALQRGADLPRAMSSGAVWLDMMVRTQVADAGRAAEGAVIAARTKVGGYTRMLTPPSCSRCAVLAGKWYRWNAGFQRHPRCDCRHIPVAEDRAGALVTHPQRYFDSLSTAEQNRTFGQAGAQAIRDGADLSKVVNARRGMQTAAVGGRKVLVTTEGTTVRGDFGRRNAAAGTARRSGQRVRSVTTARLMPEQIYAESHGDRGEAIRLLKQHGYIA